MANSVSKKSHADDISSGNRFQFGENWTRFLEVLDESRIEQAVESLRNMLETQSLAGKSFLDIGSGSGLFSLAARRLGARVLSFDFDPKSVACTRELKKRYFDNDGNWEIQTGSVLDQDYLGGLGTFDVVYSWGVLHHTGGMWSALANVDSLVASGGKLFIALYNDQGGASGRWTVIKRIYNRLPDAAKGVFAALVFLPLETRSFLIHLVRREPMVYINYIRHYGKYRGMNWWRDKIDWIGGYPFEVSKPEQIFNFYKKRGYALLQLITNAGGHGCNEYVFQLGGR